MSTLANSEDTNEMPQNVAINQGLNCLLRQKQSSKKEIQFIWKLKPVIYSIGHAMFMVSNQKEESIST